MAEANLLAGRSVLILSDAVGAVAYTNKGGGCSNVMTAIMKRLLKVCVQHAICVRAEHLRGTTMKDAGVDSLSRWGEFEVRGDDSRACSAALVGARLLVPLATRWTCIAAGQAVHKVLLQRGRGRVSWG